MLIHDAQYYAPNNYPTLVNYEVPVPGTQMVAYLGYYLGNQEQVSYSLWADNELGDEVLIATDSINFEGLDVTPLDVANAAYLLNCEYFNA